MKVIISGGGSLGRLVAESLISSGYEVTIIEKDKETCEALASTLDAMVINGDGTSPETLEEAGIKDVDIVIAISGSDQSNLITGLIAKEFGVGRIIVKLDDPAFNIVCNKLGIEEIVNPKVAIARHVSDMAKGLHLLDIATIVRGNIRAYTAEVEKEEHVEKRIEELELPANAIIAVVQRGKEFFIPRGRLKLLKGDRLFIICEEKALATLERIFG